MPGGRSTVSIMERLLPTQPAKATKRALRLGME